jgi:SAM-dependent methyltransferase
MKSIGEKFSLFFLFFLVKARQFQEELKIRRRFYSHPFFKTVDQALCSYYFLNNPYRISKRFLQQRGEKNLYAYGETPLTSLEKIAKQCGLGPADHLLELGCGTGRGAFFLTSLIGCKVTGIEWIGEFVKKAQELKQTFDVKGAHFQCEDMMQCDMSSASFIYLYGTNLEEAEIERLLICFSKMKKGAKLISVSYPLTDYSDRFLLLKQFSIPYPWGVAEVFLQELK